VKAPRTLRRYAIDKAVEVAKDTSINNPTKAALLQYISSTAAGQSAYGRVVYRFIAIALGLVAILVVVFAFALLLGKHTVDSAFYTLGSAAIGALGGVFAPQGSASTTPAPAATAPTPAGTTTDSAAEITSGEMGNK
jgi:hypothetical protein